MFNIFGDEDEDGDNDNGNEDDDGNDEDDDDDDDDDDDGRYADGIAPPLPPSPPLPPLLPLAAAAAAAMLFTVNPLILCVFELLVSIIGPYPLMHRHRHSQHRKADKRVRGRFVGGYKVTCEG